MFSLARRLWRGKSAEALATIENEKAVAAAKIASLVASAKTVAAVVSLARADTRHATAPDDWDADPWALNTSNGIVDLRTGQAATRPSRRARAMSAGDGRPSPTAASSGSDMSVSTICMYISISAKKGDVDLARPHQLCWDNLLHEPDRTGARGCLRSYAFMKPAAPRS